MVENFAVDNSTYRMKAKYLLRIKVILRTICEPDVYNKLIC